MSIEDEAKEKAKEIMDLIGKYLDFEFSGPPLVIDPITAGDAETPGWTRAGEVLPEMDELVLVRAKTHEGIALGKFYEDSFGKFWEVQPFREAWYRTETGILEWREIEGNNEPA